MDVSVSQENEISVVRLDGRLDSCASEEFGRRLGSVLEQAGGAVLLDCGHLTFISSAGLRVLLLASKKMQSSGRQMGMCSLSDNVREVFVISGLTKIFSIHADEAQAVAALAPPKVSA